MATSTSNIGSSIASLLGSSSIDTSSLVTQLVSAARTPRQQAITEKQSTNSARISGVASAISSLDTFASEITSTLKKADYAGQPASADPSIVAISARQGGTPSGLPAQIEVKQLASARTMVSSNATVDAGTYTLTVDGTTHNISIASPNDTAAGLASAINALSSGVTASVITDKDGSRLMLKGKTGSANDFTFSGGSMTLTSSPAPTDSIIVVDGVQMVNQTNQVDGALPYLRLDLNKAAPGTLVTLATDEPTTSIKDLVSEFVTAYNSMRTAMNAATGTSGALSGDMGMRDMMNQLSRLTSTNLASSGTYMRLSDIGVSTNRDGTLKLDATKLDAAIAADAGAVTRMINPSVATASDPGLAKVINDIKTQLQSDSGSLTTSKNKYAKYGTSLTKELEKLDTQMTKYEEQLTTTYAGLSSKLNAFKATQSYLTQQVAMWTKSNG